MMLMFIKIWISDSYFHNGTKLKFSKNFSCDGSDKKKYKITYIGYLSKKCKD